MVLEKDLLIKAEEFEGIPPFEAFYLGMNLNTFIHALREDEYTLDGFIVIPVMLENRARVESWFKMNNVQFSYIESPDRKAVMYKIL